MAQPECKKCGGLAELEAVFDESFKRMPSIRCYNCGKVEYPPAPPQPKVIELKRGRSPYHQHNSSRKGIRILATDN